MAQSADSNSSTTDAAQYSLYHPLASNEIRLVTLVAAPSYEPVVCRLTHANLYDSAIHYEALSYTWGHHNDLVTIRVNEQNFKVTRNLSLALQYLRQRDKDTIIWIDALCINQTDNEEKGPQVALMKDIYRRADHVKVWLGPPAENSDLIMRVFKEEGARLYSESDEEEVDATLWDNRWLWVQDTERMDLELDFRNVPGLEEWFEKLKSYLMDEPQNRVRRSLQALLKRDYWTRVWVVQEIFMSRRITIVCGISSCPWTHATAVLRAFEVARDARLLEALREETGGRTLSSLTQAWQRVELMMPTTLNFHRLTSEEKRTPAWLLRMLMALRHFKSTEPRDKIFSLFGLVNSRFRERNDYVHVSYDLPLLDVALGAFRFCVSGSRDAVKNEEEYRGGWLYAINSLTILCASQPSHETKSNDFPSWLPDFSRDNGMEPWPVFPNQHGGCCSCANTAFSSKNNALSVHGCFVAELRGEYTTGEDDDCLATDDLGILGRIRRIFEVLLNIGDTCWESDWFWETLTLGHVIGREIAQFLPLDDEYNLGLIDEEPADEESDEGRSYTQAEGTEQAENQSKKSGQSKERALRLLEAEVIQRNSPALRTFLNEFRNKSYRRHFAIFDLVNIRGRKRACSAMLPAEAKPGDQLFLLGECDYPVILRRCAGVDRPDRDFEFIGPCCIPELRVFKPVDEYGWGDVQVDIDSIETITLH